MQGCSVLVAAACCVLVSGFGCLWFLVVALCYCGGLVFTRCLWVV